MAVHYLDDTEPHAFWDNAFPPRLRIYPGDTVVFETRETSSNQITPASTAEDLLRVDRTLIHPLSGPVYVEGAEPGDALEVDVVSLQHKGWGWNAVKPGLGLLQEELPGPYLHHYKLGRRYCEFRKDILIPCSPFCGVVGVAPRESGRLSTHPPRENGGNLDVRQLTAGARVLIPVFVPGALFSCGDCHAAQGDGEVNGTGIEAPMVVTLRFAVRRNAVIQETRAITPPPRSTRAGAGSYVTCAHGPDLYKNAQQAVRYMIEYLTCAHDMTSEQAYCLCGAAVDLKISQIVNAPNWIVSAHLPLAIFRRSRAVSVNSSHLEGIGLS
jgi:acetamidase/formamidase